MHAITFWNFSLRLCDMQKREKEKAVSSISFCGAKHAQTTVGSYAVHMFQVSETNICPI